MSTVDETVSKVDQGLQEMGIGSVKESIKDILDFKQYLQDQIPAVTGFCIKVVLSIIVFFVGRKIILVTASSHPESIPSLHILSDPC